MYIFIGLLILKFLQPFLNIKFILKIYCLKLTDFVMKFLILFLVRIYIYKDSIPLYRDILEGYYYIKAHLGSH
jgi:hypothetical protein